ncbi:MAG: Na/Pi cotransporter family protein [Halothiobacillaceae bacterium]
MDPVLVLTFLGGVGLFLLGMRLMTEGLKVAAGDTLREILARGTATTGRGILSGVVITAMVQSSSAVIFATIGFVNAGLLSLFQAVGVIIGSNIGTTATSWLVAIVGFKVDLQALALPAIAIGTLMRVTGNGNRRAALGDALTGFGVFFLGLDVLKGSFEGFGESVDLETFAGHGLLSLLAFMLVGVVLTVIMNSSSASLAVTLTAAGSGLIPLESAAAMVIGANVGTTSTALFAVIGATSSAKRAATAHVVFNVITGVVAFASLPLLLWLVSRSVAWLDLEAGPATSLAIFHTLTKLLGTAIFWPLTPRLVSVLETRFRSIEEDEGRPRHLDRNVAGTPDLALEALSLELRRVGDLARRGARDVLSSEAGTSVQRLARERTVIERLLQASRDFALRVQTGRVPAAIAESFPEALRIGQYYGDVAEHVGTVADLEGRLPDVEDEELVETMAGFRSRAARVLDLSDPWAEDFRMKPLKQAMKDFETHYQQFKALLLHCGVAGRIPMRQMVVRLDEISAIRRIMDQAFKAARLTKRLRKTLYKAHDLIEEEEELAQGEARQPDPDPAASDAEPGAPGAAGASNRGDLEPVLASPARPALPAEAQPPRLEPPGQRPADTQDS